jgi:DNA-binding beta-propeller fold protein YncE
MRVDRLKQRSALKQPGRTMLSSLAVLAAFLVPLFGAVSAWAVRGHVFVGAFGSVGAGDGEFVEPAGVAVDEASGAVYVVDHGSNRVEWFSSAGVFEGQFNGSGDFEVEGKKEVGTPAEAGEFAGPESVAVDNSCSVLKLAEPTCHEDDPSSGDVYVLDSGHKEVDKFTATGEYLNTVAGFGSGFEGELTGVAVDSHGALRVGTHNGADSFSNEEVNGVVGGGGTRGHCEWVLGMGFEGEL